MTSDEELGTVRAKGWRPSPTVDQEAYSQPLMQFARPRVLVRPLNGGWMPVREKIDGFQSVDAFTIDSDASVISELQPHA